MGNIYEVLNDAEMDLEEFENEKLSDHESRIAKKQILKEIRKKKNKKRSWKKTFAGAAACACVILGMRTVSAAAGWMQIPDAFMALLEIHTDEEIETADRMGVSTDAAAEDHGYRISAEGMIGDGKNMGIIFKIEKSDGSALLDNGRVPAAVEFREINSKDCPWFRAVSGNAADSNHADCMEYYIIFTYRDRGEDHVSVSLENMQLWDGEEPVEVSGKWEFDIPFEIQDTAVDLAAGEKFRYGNSEGSIDELMISPMGFSVRVTTANRLSDSDFIDMPMELHLKNNEVVELNGGCGPIDNEDGTWSWRMDGVYEKIILLDTIESVVIGDTEFPVNTAGC